MSALDQKETIGQIVGYLMLLSNALNSDNFLREIGYTSHLYLESTDQNTFSIISTGPNQNF